MIFDCKRGSAAIFFTNEVPTLFASADGLFVMMVDISERLFVQISARRLNAACGSVDLRCKMVEVRSNRAALSQNGSLEEPVFRTMHSAKFIASLSDSG